MGGSRLSGCLGCLQTIGVAITVVGALGVAGAFLTGYWREAHRGELPVLLGIPAFGILLAILAHKLRPREPAPSTGCAECGTDLSRQARVGRCDRCGRVWCETCAGRGRSVFEALPRHDARALEPTATPCPECGWLLTWERRTFTCSMCHGVVEGNAAVCPHCGVRLSGVHEEHPERRGASVRPGSLADQLLLWLAGAGVLAVLIAVLALSAGGQRNEQGPGPPPGAPPGMPMMSDVPGRPGPMMGPSGPMPGPPPAAPGPKGPSPDAARHYRAGLKAKQAGQHDAAIAELQEAVKLAPDYAQAHYALAWIWASRNERAKATAEFKEVVRIGPESTEGKEAKAALKRMRAPAAKGGTGPEQR